MLAMCIAAAAPIALASAATLNVYQATLEERDQKTPEVSTEQFRLVLERKSGVILDARPEEQYAIAHIPGSINLPDKGLIRFAQSYPDRSANIIVYSNGPFCSWARHRAEQLLNLGYTKVSRYQLGLSVWRALGHTAETNLQGFRHIFTNENSAVIVDARNRTEYSVATVPGAESILAGEAGKAQTDRRLRYYDYNARIIVFSSSAENARTVAQEIAWSAYSNISYFAGSYEDLKRAKFFVPRKPALSYLDGIARQP
jgi:rhodanese-related sulfurtransferase